MKQMSAILTKRREAMSDYARSRAYIDYVKDGEEGFPEGLSFDEYHAMKVKLADEAKVEADFYNMSEDK